MIITEAGALELSDAIEQMDVGFPSVSSFARPWYLDDDETF